MYILKNAWSNLRRNAVRNLILTLIMTALLLSCAVSIIINTSAKQMIRQYKTTFSTEVMITRDDTKLPSDPSQFMIPDKKLLDKLATSKLLKDVTKTMTTAAILDGIKTINEGNQPSGKGDIVVENNGSSTETTAGYQSPNAIILATTNPEISNEFKSGSRKIVEGSIYKNKNEAIISQQLAKANNLKVNDLLTIKVSAIDPSAQTTHTQKVKITGIYEDHVKEADTSSLIALNTRANEVFISYSSTEDSLVLADGLSQYDVYFTLQDPNDLPALEKEFRAAGLPEYYRISMDDSTYQKIVGPVEGMADITKIFTLGIIGTGAVLLIILSMLSIRERKYEVGVLRAIGMRKYQVILGFLYESLFITGFSLLIALGCSFMISKPVAAAVLQEQKNTVSTEHSVYVETGIQVSNIDVSEITELPASLSSEAMIQIVLVSLLLALIASTSSVLYITRYEPMKILSERN